MSFKIIMLVISLSIDALGIGMSYCVRGIKINWKTKFIVGMMAGFMSLVAVYLGSQAVTYFPVDVIQMIATIFLCLIGIVFIWKGFHEEEKAFCDIDFSSSIELGEAILLGLALSSDSFGIGIAVATFEINYLEFPFLVAISQPLFLMLGEWSGTKASSFLGEKQKICTIGSGILLMLIAILQNLG